MFFYGANQQFRWELLRSLRRFSAKKALNDLEELVYGENGIEIYRNDERLNAKNIDFYFVKDSFSIYQEVSFSKTSLMTDFLNETGQDLIVTNELEKIKNHLLQLELIFNEKMSQISDNISVNLTDLSAEDLMKNHLFLSYSDKKHDFPLEMMDANELIDEYLNLLTQKLEHHPRESWIVLENLATFLSSGNIQSLISGLSKIAQDTGLLKILILSNQVLDYDYQTDDIEKTVILADEVYQLPPFLEFRQSLENHYPDKLETSDKVLCQMFFSIVDKVGADGLIAGKIERKMIILKVINELFGINNWSFSVKSDQLSALEKAYLSSKD